MNYRLLLTEMLIDYKERRDESDCGKTFKVYTEIIEDLVLALELEPGMQENINIVNELIK